MGVDKRIVDWIKVEKNKGYSESELKDVLVLKGHPLWYVQEAIRSSRNIGEILGSVLVMLVFIIVLIVFSIVGLMINAFFGGFVIGFFLIGIMTFLFGYMFSNQLRKFGYNQIGYLINPLVVSSVLGVVFAFLAEISLYLYQFYKRIETTSGGFLIPMFDPNPVEPYMAFGIFLVFFNASFVYQYIKREDKRLVFLLLYLFPVFLHIASFFLFRQNGAFVEAFF